MSDNDRAKYIDDAIESVKKILDDNRESMIAAPMLSGFVVRCMAGEVVTMKLIAFSSPARACLGFDEQEKP